MANKGCLMVVNPTGPNSPAGLSSNPMIEISSGTLMPFSMATEITSRAMSSLAAKMAVGGLSKEKKRW